MMVAERGEIVGNYHRKKKAISNGKLKSFFSRITLVLWFCAVLCGLIIFAVPEVWKWRVAMLFIIIFAVFGIIMMIYNYIDKKEYKEKEADAKYKE